MAFTYGGDPANSNLEWVRWRIGDTFVNDGPRPRASTAANSNFNDAEIEAAISDEGTKGKAAALMCETLATEWSSFAGTTQLADYSEANRQAEHFRDMAQDLRRKYGSGRVVTQSAPTRVDGYSDDVDAEEV
jgi:hypothetical protein